MVIIHESLKSAGRKGTDQQDSCSRWSWSLTEDSTRLTKGLRRKLVESRSLVSGKARGTLDRTEAQDLIDAWNSA
jgi:hypothetical protein